MKRRTFLFAGAAAAGGLVIGYRSWAASFARGAARQVEAEGEHLLAGWLKIADDDTVTVYVPHVDMGQGVHTALAMLAAEELDADWSKMRAERAPAEKSFANSFLARGWILDERRYPVIDGAVAMGFAEIARFINLQITGGSTAVRMTGRLGMRQVGAAARAMLVEAAAQNWNVPTGRIEVQNGIVSDPGTGRAARFGELAGLAATLRVPRNVSLKPPSQWRLAGTSPGRLDIPAKTDGSFGYGIDLALPDMVHAALRSSPVHGRRLVDCDLGPARAMPGVIEVLHLETAVAVIAESWWQAQQAAEMLEPVFEAGMPEIGDDAALAARQQSLIATESGSNMLSRGDAARDIAVAPAERIVEATYRVPHLHHAAMEPISLTVQIADGRLTVWGGEQDSLGARQRLAELSGMRADRVEFIGLAAGGSFGRRIPASADYLAHLPALARAASPRPVKLILSREEEFAQGSYRPALATRITGSLDADGAPRAWRQTFLAGPTRNEAWLLPYAIPSQSIRSIDFATHMHTGTWRAVAHTQHAFWTESFIDELAHAARRDPFEFRRDLLEPGSRPRRVLEAAAEMANWQAMPQAGRSRGIALHESYGTVVAEVVEVSLQADGLPAIHTVWAAVDCGRVIHPDTARQQVEGSIIMGLSAALFEEITMHNGAVEQKNFHDYRVMQLADTPNIEIRFLESDGPWGGLGEPALPPAAPALCNALFPLTGQRIRELPIARALRAGS